MGTYKLIPTAINAGGSWTLQSGSSILHAFQPGVANESGARAPLAGGTIRFDFSQTTAMYLDGSGTPTTYSGLPAGFTPTTAVLHHNASIGGTPTYGDAWGQFEVGVEDPTQYSNSFTYPGTIPTALNLFLGGCGLRGNSTATSPVDVLTATLGSIYISGNYSIASWWYNPSTNHYAYSSYPGAPWTASSTPVPAITTISPAFGCTSTAVTITGTGFGDAATVTFGGVAATSVVIVDSTSITCVTGAHADGAVNVVVTNADATTATAVSGYTYGTPYWLHSNTVVVNGVSFTFQDFVQQCTTPGATYTLYSLTVTKTWWYNATLGWYVYQVASPGTGWAAGSAPAVNGWYMSPAAFGGSIVIAANGRPKDPRKWASIDVWAVSGTGMLGGSPAASAIFENRMVYPANDYTVGTDYPPIRVFDGSFDRELCRLPPTTSNTIPKAVLSMLAANGTIYLTSFDSGTTSADWRGRVFQLDLASGVLTPLGTNFAAGEMPYALTWHMGRLWCGTNNGIGTVGKVYYFRPGIDTTWTLDYSLSTSSVGGVDSLCSYKGKLYVGSDNAAASFAKILVRDTAGAYTTTDTGTGGTARVNNGFIAMTVFGENLYASYWNNDTTAISKIRKFDNTTWTTAYTGAATTLKPFILLFADNSLLYGVGGAGKTLALTGAIVSTPDGTTWTNKTAQLTALESGETLLPIYGVEIL